MKLRIFIATLAILGSLLIGEVGLQLLALLQSNQSLPAAEAHAREIDLQALSQEESDSTKPLYTSEQNSACLKIILSNSLKYHPRFGFFTKVPDKSCMRRSFSNQSKVSVVYLGGSVMGNYDSVNSLTTIDTQIQKINPSINSINLAESGARLSNELSRLVDEVIDIAPRLVVFLDGYNEFNSIRFGGAPTEDFYWTAGVHMRIEKPLMFIADRAISKSEVLSLIFFRSGLIKSPFGVQRAPTDEEIDAAADDYLISLSKIQTISKAYGIQPVFFLQPHIFSGKALTEIEAHTAELTLRAFPGIDHVLQRGYARILSSNVPSIIDLSEIFNTINTEIFVDSVHLGKLGNRILGQAMGEKLQTLLAKDQPA